MTNHMITIKNQESPLIIPVSKKAITAVGIDEKRVYVARFKDGLLLIGDLTEDIADNAFKRGKDIGYQTGFSEGYDEGLMDGAEEGYVEGYQKGYDAMIGRKGYRQMHFHDCGLDCNFDCAHCRFKGM